MVARPTNLRGVLQISTDWSSTSMSRALPAGADLTADRIMQEGLTNALKHASPARACVTISYASGAPKPRIAADGRGVNGTASSGGHGLLGMRERVAVDCRDRA